MLGKNIRYLRTQANYSQDKLAELLGYKSFTTIQKWESGVSNPPFSTVKKISELFHVDIDTLNSRDLSIHFDCYTKQNGQDVYIEVPAYHIPSSQRLYRTSINVLGRVAAGIPINAIQEVIDTEEITEDLAKTGDFFGLKIKGDSMEPRICNGDVVIVRQQNDAESGDIVIAMVNGNDATCKRLVKYSSSIALVSLNSKYEPMMFTNEEIESKPVKIIGKVVELRGKL